MTNLAALLDTWQQWSAHNVMSRAVGDEAGEAVVRAIDALRDSHELVELLSAWQWQAVYAARGEGASWAQIAATVGAGEDEVRADYVAVLLRQENLLGRDVSQYRSVL